MSRTARKKHRPASREVLLARLGAVHVGMAPRLDAGQIRDLELAHYEQGPDAIARGDATAATLWSWAGGCLTWSRVAQEMRRGEREMQSLLDVVGDVIQRFMAGGKIGFSGAQYQAAKAGTEVMGELAKIVPRLTAIAAAEWSDALIGRIERGTAAWPEGVDHGAP